MAAKIFRINYKSDFIATLHSDAGWMTPFCIKFWTGAPSQAFYAGWDGTTYTHCSYDPAEPTKLVVQFDDHHLPIGDLKFQIVYHFTVSDFPNDTEDEVINPADVMVEIDGETYQVMLDFTGETAPEIQFSLPAYANEAQRIENEMERERKFTQMEQNFTTMQQESEQATDGAENVDAELNGTILTVTNREGESVSHDVQGPQGIPGPAGSDADVTEENIERALGFTPQQQLVSGQNIKTINNQPLLGSGNIEIQGGSGEVISVNGKKGVVVLNSEDVGAASQSEVTAIEELIPQQATAQNQLADKNFVNSSVSTNTAYYISDNGQPFTSLAALEAYSGQLTNNDYAFVVGTDAAGNTTYTRYKYNADTQQWTSEYVLNNSSFTAAQWAAIQSGITSGKVEKLTELPTMAQLDAMLGGKEDKSNKVTELTSQSTDTQYPSAKAVYDFVKEETEKKIETIHVVASADSGSVAGSAVLKIKVNGSVVAQGVGSLSYEVEFDTVYTVEAERVYDYLTPASQTFTAGQSERTVTMAYTYIQRDTITIDQTETDEQTMVSGDVQGNVIKAIRAASHLYLGKQTEAGNQLICQLKDDDGTKYYDGTAAAMDGTEGDQWLKLPVFWWKVTPIGTADADDTYDQYSFSFAFAGEPDPSWHKWEGDTNLLGAKKMYVTGGKGYSRSGIQGSANFTQTQGKTYAEARGTGYSCVTWEWQWMMCVLFYAWYGRMNSQAQCGSGSDSNTRTLGTKDSLGMTDTTSSNGNSDNTKFWGIENWWGDINEWIGNITSQDYVVTIVDMNTKQSRTVSGWYQFNGTGGYASRFKVTDLLDFIPRAKNGTETTCYCDWVNGNTGSRVVGRSGGYASAGGGVACVYSNNDPSGAGASVGSRLAFNGVITEAESVAAYKAA